MNFENYLRYLREDLITTLFMFTVVLVFFSNIYYILLNNVPQSWDPALHMYYSLIYFYLIQSLNFADLIHVSNYYPPFFHLSSIPLYFLFGFSEKIAIFTNIIYYFILLYSVFKISEFLKDKKTGMLSAIVVSFFPILIQFQRVYMIDFALTSLVALTVYFYLRSKDFRNRKYSILFGLSFGLSELTKWNAFIYIVPAIVAIFLINYLTRCPYCYEVVSDGIKQGLRKFCSEEHLKLYKNQPKKQYYLNISLSLIVAFIIAAWWYLPNFNVTLARLMYFANIGGKEGDPTFLTITGWTYYANSILNSIGVIFLALFLISLVYLYKKDRITLVMILSSILLPYIILTILSNKDPRYIMPILPFIALSIGIFTREFIDNKIGKVILTLIMTIGILNVTALTFAWPTIDNKILPKPNHPKNKDWKIDEILKTIWESGGYGRIVVALADHPYLNGQSLEFYRLKDGYPFVIYNGVYIGYNVFVNNFDKISYIIVIEPREHKGVYGDIEAKLYEFFYRHKDQFNKIATFNLPDGSRVDIYKRK